MKHSAEQVAADAGVSPELALRLWTAMGFTQRPDEMTFTDDDVRAMRFVGDLIRSGSMEEDAIVQLARTMASSVARVADAQVEVAVDRARRFGKDEIALVDQTVVDQTPWLLGYMWRRHAEVALRRAYETGDDASLRAVGFADLVGFTQMSQTLAEDELSRVIDRFVLLANDVVVVGGGRVIKTIGDEVMFDAPDARSALEIALTLAERYRDDEELSDVRVGLAAGDVLAHDGDLFGPPVNLAARIVAVARPGSVVIPESIHALVADDPGYRFRTLRPRLLKGIGRVSLYRVRRAG
jgi:adenylate cyclase